MQFKKVCLATQNGQANLKFAFIKAFTVSLFLLQLLFACNPAFYFIMGKTYEDISFSSTSFCYYGKHPNNDNICPISFSVCF